MSNIVLKVENLSKQYRLGEVGTGTLSHDLNRWWHKVRGKGNPYVKIGEINDRTQKKGGSDYVWALKEINFEVQEGEVLGVIGRNGAGKSTLLKVLSKVTGATSGNIKVRGRIASLLEVGTGFHPELTGRENIYMNGTIMGMTRYEITRKLEEIVEFAGVAKYLDTPVKRYSSGMMVRLGFAVAAHLEPEILIVDEVLAVGDAEFQKKAIGKMQDVSKGQGRTVLFVSHNMWSIENLCNRGILLEKGEVIKEGDAFGIVRAYLEKNKNKVGKIEKLKTDNPFVFIESFEICKIELGFNKPISFNLNLVVEKGRKTRVGIGINNSMDSRIITSISNEYELIKGINTIKLCIELPTLPKGDYNVDLGIIVDGKGIFYSGGLIGFEIETIGYSDPLISSKTDKAGVIMPLIMDKM